jgi:hypothetical protein
MWSVWREPRWQEPIHQDDGRTLRPLDASNLLTVSSAVGVELLHVSTLQIRLLRCFDSGLTTTLPTHGRKAPLQTPARVWPYWLSDVSRAPSHFLQKISTQHPKMINDYFTSQPIIIPHILLRNLYSVIKYSDEYSGLDGASSSSPFNPDC